MRFKSSTAIAAGTALFVLLFPVFFTRAQQPDRQLTQGAAQPQVSQRRVALVIGNGAYEHAGRLANPPNDAMVVAATLRQLGFEVKNGSNLTQREMKQRIREFGQTLRANGGVGLFYFAGHGVQAKGHNYLVPIDADIQSEADLEDVAVDLNYVLSLMDDAKNALNIVVLDACRNNPFARSFRSAEAGLAQVRAPTGTLIAYATSPDSVAADGSEGNSPYTLALVAQLKASGVLVETMFRRVTEQVSARTNGKQEPWFSANVKGDFFFNGGSTPAVKDNGGSTSAVKDNATLTEPDRVKPLVSNRLLNDKALSLPRPQYPEIARATRLTGEVEVEVVVDESGIVISAHALTGPALLQAAAVAAAREAKFASNASKISGILIYSFKLE